jgi:hypothetical protein
MSSLNLLPSLARLAPARLAELNALLPSLHSASTRAASANRPSQARAYARQHAAASRELATWNSLVRAARGRAGAGALLAVTALHIAAAAPATATFLAVGAVGLLVAARDLSQKGPDVRPWTKIYAMEQRVGKVE